MAHQILVTLSHGQKKKRGNVGGAWRQERISIRANCLDLDVGMFCQLIWMCSESKDYSSKPHLIGCGVWGQLNTRGHFSNCYNLQEPRDNLQEQRTFCFQNIREAIQIRVGHADASADAHWMILWPTLLLWIRQTFAYAHWGEAPPLFRVWKIIGWNGILKNHMLTHSGEKSHRCTQCKKTNQESGDLRAHFLIHTGEKLIQLPNPIQEHTLRHK